MFDKLLAFVLMSAGGFVIYLAIVHGIPSLHHTAFSISNHLISWANLLATAFFTMICYLTNKAG